MMDHFGQAVSSNTNRANGVLLGIFVLTGVKSPVSGITVLCLVTLYNVIFSNMKDILHLIRSDTTLTTYFQHPMYQ